MPSFRENRRLWVIFIIFLTLAVLAGGYLAYLSRQGVPETVAEPTAEATILDGTYVCLPRADAAKTKECTPGVKVGDDYYALDLARLLEAGETTNFSNGTKILAAGAITPIEEVSDEQWKTYRVKGVMRVEEVARK